MLYKLLAEKYADKYYEEIKHHVTDFNDALNSVYNKVYRGWKKRNISNREAYKMFKCLVKLIQKDNIIGA